MSSSQPKKTRQIPQPHDNTVAVSCGCFGSKRRRRKFKKKSKSKNSDDENLSEFFDPVSESPRHALYFFDAEQSALDPEFYPPSPMHATKEGDEAVVEPLLEPIGEDERKEDEGETKSRSSFFSSPRWNRRKANKSKNASTEKTATPESSSLEDDDVPLFPPHRSEYPTILSSEQLQAIVMRPIEEQLRNLKHPPKKLSSKSPQFPGYLTDAEMEECRKFLEGVQADFPERPEVAEIVYGVFHRAETPEYATCRFLRATKFEASKILERLRGADFRAEFLQAKAADFYPDLSLALGTSGPAFLSQYPFLTIGNTRAGFPVSYIQYGRVQPEGLMALTTIPNVGRYFWNQYAYKFQDEIVEANQNLGEESEHVLPTEAINVLDLSGINRGMLTSETMDFVKVADKISDYFPETLHSMIILNAPGYFTLFWAVIKRFLDPRTAERIHIYSSKSKGMERLRTWIDDSQIPSDYGGSNKSFEEVLLEKANAGKQSGTNGKKSKQILRQDIQLLSIFKHGGTKAGTPIELKQGERASISVFSRSSSSAKLVVRKQGTTVTNGIAKGGPGGEPQGTWLTADLPGPGSFEIEAKDLNDADVKGASWGHFLVVCDVR